MDRMAEIRLEQANQLRRNQAREAAEDRLVRGSMRRSDARTVWSKVAHAVAGASAALHIRGRVGT